MKRSGFTLIELLVVLAIISILVALIVPSLGGKKYYATKISVRAKVVRKYEVPQPRNCMRVDYQVLTSSAIQTVIVENDTWLQFYSGDTIYANLEPGKWYELSLVGYRDEYWEYFPKIVGSTPLAPQDQ